MKKVWFDVAGLVVCLAALAVGGSMLPALLLAIAIASTPWWLPKLLRRIHPAPQAQQPKVVAEAVRPGRHIWLSRMQRYVDGPLSRRKAVEVKRHIERCKDCWNLYLMCSTDAGAGE